MDPATMMNIHEVSTIALLLFLAIRTALHAQAELAEARQSPNILLIVGDDLGPHLGCYGDDTIRTRNLDSLARQGVLFSRAYVTHASCSPSRSSILTGLYPHQNGQIGLVSGGYSMRGGLPTLPKILSQNGYSTGIIGKLHVEPRSDFPFDFSDTNSKETREVAKVAKKAEEFFGQSKGKPFFLMVNFEDPHRPFYKKVHGIPTQAMESRDVKPFSFLPIDTSEVREETARYYDCVSRLDFGVGLLLHALNRSGREGDTLVLFLGDHGPAFTRGKLTCYEAGLRVPFILRMPSEIHAGTIKDEFVSTVDILPTIAELCGIATPKDLAGRSLLPLIEGKATAWRTHLFGEYTSHHLRGYFPRRSVRDERYKLILNLASDRSNPCDGPDGSLDWEISQRSDFDDTFGRTIYNIYNNPPAEELYDLVEDPNELHNLAGNLPYHDIENQLRKELREWREKTNDPLLNPEVFHALTIYHDKATNVTETKLSRKRLFLLVATTLYVFATFGFWVNLLQSAPRTNRWDYRMLIVMILGPPSLILPVQLLWYLS